MGKRFDDLSKKLGTGVSRRQALLGAIGGAGAAVLATIMPGQRARAAGITTDTIGFCATLCNSEFPGNPQGIYACEERCFAEFTMGQGPFFTNPNGPGYAGSCANPRGPQCAPPYICCNGTCCKPELCGVFGIGQIKLPFVYRTNGTVVPIFPLTNGTLTNGTFTNGTYPAFAERTLCLGCGRDGKIIIIGV